MKHIDDISALKPAHLQQIVEMIPEIIILLDKNGYVQYANAKGREHLGAKVLHSPIRYGEFIGCKYYDEKSDCGASHYCDFCEISQILNTNTKTLRTIDVVRDVKIFDESVIKRFSFAAFNLAESNLIVMMIKIL